LRRSRPRHCGSRVQQPQDQLHDPGVLCRHRHRAYPRVYAALAAGQLRARKFGKRTIITAEDGRAFLASLPELSAA
jgi:hypothetical protein